MRLRETISNPYQEPDPAFGEVVLTNVEDTAKEAKSEGKAVKYIAPDTATAKSLQGEYETVIGPRDVYARDTWEEPKKKPTDGDLLAMDEWPKFKKLAIENIGFDPDKIDPEAAMKEAAQGYLITNHYGDFVTNKTTPAQLKAAEAAATKAYTMAHNKKSEGLQMLRFFEGKFYDSVNKEYERRRQEKETQRKEAREEKRDIAKEVKEERRDLEREEKEEKKTIETERKESLRAVQRDISAVDRSLRLESAKPLAKMKRGTSEFVDAALDNIESMKAELADLKKQEAALISKSGVTPDAKPQGETKHPLAGQKPGRYRVNGKIVKWDGSQEM